MLDQLASVVSTIKRGNAKNEVRKGGYVAQLRSRGNRFLVVDKSLPCTIEIAVKFTPTKEKEFPLHPPVQILRY